MKLGRGMRGRENKFLLGKKALSEIIVTQIN